MFYKSHYLKLDKLKFIISLLSLDSLMLIPAKVSKPLTGACNSSRSLHLPPSRLNYARMPDNT